MRTLRPSRSATELNRATIASSAASFTSPLGFESRVLTRAVTIAESLLLRALPATVTNVAKARALKADVGEAIKVGMRIGKTVFART